MKTAGKVNRRLALLKIQGEQAGETTLVAEDKEVGEITSVSPLTHDSKRVALGYLGKRGFESTRFTLGSGAVASFVRWA